jgi:glycerol kinase
LETTALGSAYLAGLAVGYWKNIDEIQSQWIVDKDFHPKLEKEKVEKMVKTWNKAVQRSQNWIED